MDPQQISNNYVLPLHCAETERARSVTSCMTTFSILVFSKHAKITVLWNALEVTLNVKRSVGICGLKGQLYLIDWFDSELVGSYCLESCLLFETGRKRFNFKLTLLIPFLNVKALQLLICVREI